MIWQPIETALKDEAVPILVWFDHDADTYYDPADPMRLTDYAAIAEGGDYFKGSGVAVAIWRDGYHDSDGWESANSYWVPGGWFDFHDGDAADQVVNATHWMPLPAPPSDSGRHSESEDASAAEGEACQSGHEVASPKTQINREGGRST